MQRITVKVVTLMLLFLSLFGSAWAQSGPAGGALELQSKVNLEAFRTLAVQQGGRLKPFDTFAREAVRLITGKEEFEGADPVATVLYWWSRGGPDSQPKTFDLAVIEVRNLDLKQELGLTPDKRWFSYSEIQGRPEFGRFVEELQKLPPNSKAPRRLQTVQELLTRMHSLRMVSSGQSLTMVPGPSNKMEDPWSSLSEARAPLGDLVAKLRKSVAEVDAPGFATATEEVGKVVQSMGAYPTYVDMAREVHYNHFHPFRKAWMLYLFTLVCLFLASGSQGGLYWTGLSTACFGWALHSYGFYLRCSIGGRPPVTNMYESVIWVAFGAVFFSLVFEFLYRARSYLLASTAGAVVCLILADTLPAVLDPSIRPLTPVLRSNFWLTIHVLTITLGYAAFMLSVGLGHMVLFKYVAAADQKETLRGLNKALYKSLQVGVLLLAAGTLLGGVWANYSWGRFWGWDPKEVWALIALLGYLAILHGRYAGWLGNFGTAAASVLAFQGVLMAWYGVNFVLGAGLHSYGFGDGGVQYVACFTVAEVVLVGLAVMRYRSLRTSE